MATRSATGRTRIGLWDRLLMNDVGLVRLLAAGRVLLCLPAGMAAGYFVSEAVGLPAVVGLMLGALPAFLSCFVVVDEKASRVAARTGALYVPFVLALFCSIALRELRLLELVLIVVLLFVQFYSSRFGVWAGDFGAGLFAAYLCGLLLPLPLASFPALALIFAASVAATVLVRTAVFHPNAYRSLMRARRAFLGHETAVLEAASRALRAGDRSGLDALHRRRARAREAALTADGLLARPGVGHSGDAAQTLHTLLFDTEQAVEGLARVAAELVVAEAPAALRGIVADAIETVAGQGGREGTRAATELQAAAARLDVDRAWSGHLARTALLLADLRDASADWSRLRSTLPKDGAGVPFESPVVLLGGRPAGAAPVLGAEIADGRMAGPWSRVRVSPALRTAIQAAIAVAIAEPIAFLVDGQRFYWAVIGVMVVLAGTNSTHDRVRKLVSRGLGTILGGVVGIAGVALLGTTHPWWTLAVVVVCLAGGMYAITLSYTLWTTGLVIVLCQVYDYSGQFTDSLIAYRLAENLLGAGIAVLVGMVVLPVATGAMIRRAQLRQLAAVRVFLEAAAELGDGPASAARLRSASRAVDQAGYQLEAVLRPLVRFPSGQGRLRSRADRDDSTAILLAGIRSALSGIAYRGERHQPLRASQTEALRAVIARMLDSLDVLSHAVAARGAGSTAAAPDQPWRSADTLIAELAASLGDGHDDELLGYRLRGLGRVDEALGELAVLHGATLDTAAIATVRAGGGAGDGAGDHDSMQSHENREFPAASPR